ncbi:hypothetical protein [Nocardioides sp.]|uniref:lipopolysaccharide biosynthesis protein n=1 Tax=Nocardioides sp. TaxID=35761 RepID=UPI002637AFE9|nr:hypothetical protein [Nocardioides sp.]
MPLVAISASAIMVSYRFLFSGLSHGVFVALLSGAVSVSCCICWVTDANVLLANGRHLAFATLNLVQPLSNFVFLLFLVCVDWLSLETYIYLYTFTAFLCVCTSTVLVRVSFRGSGLPLGDILSDSSRYVGGQLSEAASYRLDQALSVSLAGATQAGLYSVSATIALVPLGFAQALLSRSFAGLLSSSGRDQSLRLTLLFRATTAIGFLVGLVGALLCPLVVPVLFGPGFSGAIFPAMVGLGGAVFLMIAYVACGALTALGLPWRMTSAQVSGLVVSLVCIFFSGPRMGALGFAIAGVLGYLVTAVFAVCSLPKVPWSCFFPTISGVVIAVRWLFGRPVHVSR